MFKRFRRRFEYLTSIISALGIYNSAKLAWRYKFSPIRHLTIGISGSCNLKCIYCPRLTSTDKPANMSLDSLVCIENVLQRVFLVSISSRDETLIHPKFVEILERVSAYGCLISFHTNGMALTENISKKLIENKAAWMGISIDGATATTHDSLRIGADFNLIIKNIKTLQAMKKEYKSRLPILQLNFVAMKSNFHELPDYVDLAYGLGIKAIKVNGLAPHSEEMVSEVLYRPEMRVETKKYFELAEEKATRHGLSLKLLSLTPQEPHCYPGPQIRPDGLVCPCFALAYDYPIYLSVKNGVIEEGKKTMQKKVIGDISKDPLEKILKRDEFIEFKNKILSGEFPPECDNCLVKYGIIC